jgi:hypothetical protein
MMPSMPRLLLFSALALGLPTGCVPLTADGPDRRDLFTALHQGDLSRFENNLALEEHALRADAWTELGRALLALANCEELPRPSPLLRQDPNAHLLYHLVALEDQRRLRLIAGARLSGTGSWHSGTIHTQIASRSYFSRDPAPVENLIRWPAEEEIWPDEWPAPSEIPYACEALAERLAEDPAREYFSEWALTDRVLEHIASNEVQEELATVADLIHVHRADLALLLLDTDFENADPRQRARIESLARGALEVLLERTAPDEADRPHLSRWGQSLRRARLAIELDDPEAAEEALLLLSDHPVLEVAESARYLRAQIGWRQGWWEVVAEEIAPPRRESPLFNAHVYFVATANRYLGRGDIFLGLAREALADRPRPQDPFLGALYREVLQDLVRYDIDERTFEVLEELGPRSALAERQRELAEVALDLGRPEIARELATPLLEDTRDGRRIPRLHAVLALAAFSMDDRSGFDEHLDALTRRSEGLDAAIPRHRRAQFFAHRDTELARVLRAMLPMMAEWGDDRPARALRQVWLTRVVEHTQRFLREAPESGVSDQLTELYNLASQLLEDHPRGYASRVGDGSYASALVLGTVAVPLSPPDDAAPRPRLRWGPIDSLVLFPLDPIPPQRFSHVLQPDDGGGSS